MFTPTRWVVIVSVKSALSGRTIKVMSHDCRDRLHAQTLLAELRDLAEQLQDFMPGMTAAGMEIATPESLAAPRRSPGAG